MTQQSSMAATKFAWERRLSENLATASHTDVMFQAHGTELVLQSEVDVLRGVIASIDGEKDPRCLMLSFQLAQQVICIYEEAVPQVQPACLQESGAAIHAYKNVSHDNQLLLCLTSGDSCAGRTHVPTCLSLSHCTLCAVVLAMHSDVSRLAKHAIILHVLGVLKFSKHSRTCLSRACNNAGDNSGMSTQQQQNTLLLTLLCLLRLLSLLFSFRWRQLSLAWMTIRRSCLT